MKIPKSYLNPKVKFGKSKVQGKGMFADEDVNKGERILVWGGVWNRDYTDKMGLKKAIEDKKHIIQWDSSLYSIEYDGKDPLYYINHSCNPSAWLVDNFTLVARRKISNGDEITADYATWETGNYISKWLCKCGSKDCRKTITGNDWKSKKFQSKYKGHATGLIDKLIKEQDD